VRRLGSLRPEAAHVPCCTDRKRLTVNLGPTELIIVLAIFMFLFGATRLPKLARSLGESAKELKHATSTIDTLDEPRT
jgi:TatA/E family protein of Tat protein translocase